MDKSVRASIFELKTPNGFLPFRTYVPTDNAPVSFKEACASLRGDWDKRNLGFRIRAMSAISAEVSNDFGIKSTMPICVLTGKDGAAPAVYLPDYNIALFSLDFLSAKDIVRTLPHESHHFCQYALKRMNPELIAPQHREKLDAWFSTEYISHFSEDKLGYHTQPLEFDTFQYTYDFLKKHDLPTDFAALDLAAAIDSKSPETHAIVASPKLHLEKLASLLDEGKVHLGCFIPGGHSILSQPSSEGDFHQIQAFRTDPVLNENPSLSNIISHLAHVLKPRKVFFLVPGKNVDKLFKGLPAIMINKEAHINPRALLEATSPKEFINHVAEYLGVTRPKTKDVLPKRKPSGSEPPRIPPNKGGPIVG